MGIEPQNPPARASLGLAFDGSEAAAELAALARAAEAGGVGTVWIANHLFQRDPVVQSAALLAATERLRAGLMAMSPYATHPVQAAMAAASLDEHFPGRVTLSFGAGSPGDFDNAGIARPQPLQTLRESLEITRALLAGETVRHDGAVFQVRGRALQSGAHAVPLVLAAMGPRMLRLAGKCADGVLLSGGSCPEFVAAALADVDAGAGARRVRKSGLVVVSVDADEARAHDRLRTLLAFILRGAHHRANVEAAGLELDQQALYEAGMTGDWERARALITDEIVNAHAASGTPEQVRARIADFRRAGLDEIVIWVPEAGQLADVLQAVGGA